MDDNPLWQFIPATLLSNATAAGQVPKSCERGHNGANATSFDPGVGSPPGSPTRSDVREITLWVFPQDMLPGRLDEPDEPYAIGVNRFVPLVA